MAIAQGAGLHLVISKEPHEQHTLFSFLIRWHVIIEFRVDMHFRSNSIFLFIFLQFFFHVKIQLLQHKINKHFVCKKDFVPSPFVS